jgi:hypothetical protein
MNRDPFLQTFGAGRGSSLPTPTSGPAPYINHLLGPVEHLPVGLIVLDGGEALDMDIVLTVLGQELVNSDKEILLISTKGSTSLPFSRVTSHDNRSVGYALMRAMDNPKPDVVFIDSINAGFTNAKLSVRNKIYSDYAGLAALHGKTLIACNYLNQENRIALDSIDKDLRAVISVKTYSSSQSMLRTTYHLSKPEYADKASLALPTGFV